MAIDPVRLILDIELVDESLIGRVTTADGTSRRFEGWLGLLAVLEAALPSGGYANEQAE